MTIPQIRKQQLSDLELIFASRRLRRPWAGLGYLRELRLLLRSDEPVLHYRRRCLDEEPIA